MNIEADKVQKNLEELIGAKTEIEVVSGLYKGSYPSLIQEISGGEVAIAHPMLKGALLPMLRDLEFNVKIEGGGSFYRTTVSVVRRVISAPIPLLWVKLLSPLEKVQRRMFVRVFCSLKGQAFLLEADSETEDGEPLPPLPQSQWFPVQLKDISLGGVGMSVQLGSTDFCRVNGRYLLSLTIEDVSFFLVCRLIKVFKQVEKSHWEVGIAYEGLPILVERLIGSYIREQELSRGGQW